MLTSLEGVELLCFEGESVGVVVLFLRGDGDAGDSGLRKGEARLGEVYERGEGLYDVDMDCGGEGILLVSSVLLFIVLASMID